MVTSSFREVNIRALYSNDMLSIAYYIVGWHITACLKAGRIRVGKKNDGLLGKGMISLFERGIVDQKDTDNIRTEKVVRLKMFGGLKFVSAAYFDFVLRLEYVFVRYLTSTKLAVLGSSLVQRVFADLATSIDLEESLYNMMSGSDDVVEDKIMDEPVGYLVRTYCRMRGKDFCRNMMATNFKNLGKGVRPTLAVLSHILQ